MIDLTAPATNDNVYGKPSPEGDELLMAFNARVKEAMNLFDKGLFVWGLAELRNASTALLLQTHRQRQAGQENK